MSGISDGSLWYATALVASLSIGFLVGVNYARSPRENSHLDSSLSADEDCKMALVVRTDLGMSTGKIAAQCSAMPRWLVTKHYKSIIPPFYDNGSELDRQTKVALRCSNEAELLDLQTKAKNLRLCARSIQDAGRTQIAAGSRTVIGIAGPTRLVNQVTSKLRLL